EKEHVQIFRASTVRKNVAYRVIDISGIGRKRDKEKMVLGLIQKNIRKHSTGKVVVYSNTVPKAKTIAGSLGCDAYHHHAVGKEHMLDDFREGRQPIIVATSALGMGVDIPDIRCIIHVDRPRTLLDYAQESGRAGRDGKRSEAIAIEDNEENPWEDDEQTMEEREYMEEQRQLVQTYMKGGDNMTICRRVTLDAYLDGMVDRISCKEGEELCDVCTGEIHEESDEISVDMVGNEKEMERVEMQHEFQQQERERRRPRESSSWIA